MKNNFTFSKNPLFVAFLAACALVFWAFTLSSAVLLSPVHAQNSGVQSTTTSGAAKSQPFGDPLKYTSKAQDAAIEAAVKNRPPAYVYTLDRKTDRTLRAVLVRWTQAAGWTHEPEHWTLPFDYPVAGSADLGTDFKAAVRSLLISTKQTDRPVKPCFHSNQILRVVPDAQLCDPTATTTEPSITTGANPNDSSQQGLPAMTQSATLTPAVSTADKQ
jgi:hypothetical protein